jgi:hypothetical protein
MELDNLDRRELLKTVSAAAGLIGGRAGSAEAQAVKWSSGTEAPKLKAPANATDCHHHIYDAKYPVDPKATLRPADAFVEDYRALKKRIGTTRNVIVQPSTYGIDNRCTLDACGAATGLIPPRRTSRTTRCSSTCSWTGSRTRRRGIACWWRTPPCSMASSRRPSQPLRP